MTLQIKVTPSRNPHQLLHPKRKLERNICTSPSIMSQPVPLMDIIPHQLLLQSHTFKEGFRVLNPLFVEWFPSLITRRDEVLNLHLFKLSRTKDEVTWRDLISERFANLSNTKGKFAPRRPQYIFVVDKDTLSSLWTEVRYRGCILHGTHIGLKHEVEVPRHRQGRFVTPRARNLSHFLFSNLRQVFKGKWLNRHSLLIRLFQQLFRLRLGRLDHILIIRLQNTHKSHGSATLLQSHRGAKQLIGTIPQLGLPTIHHGIRESI
mmetsp:Transcript_20379/g.43974  ORF Transcript_20379/g.43974 Transcript_20379/m.43974 type:complete len:263 (+) Transcript_20379:1760-2548(+)